MVEIRQQDQTQVKAAEKAKANKFDKFTEQSKQFELQ